MRLCIYQTLTNSISLTESQDKYDSRDLEKLQKDDALVESYLTWRHFVVEDTLKMIDESLQWRKEFNLNGTHVFFTEQGWNEEVTHMHDSCYCVNLVKCHVQTTSTKKKMKIHDNFKPVPVHNDFMLRLFNIYRDLKNDHDGFVLSLLSTKDPYCMLSLFFIL